MRQLDQTDRMTMAEAEIFLEDAARDMNKMIGLLLMGGKASCGNNAMLSMCQAAQFTEQAVAQIRQHEQQAAQNSRLAIPQMMPPMRRN